MAINRVTIDGYASLELNRVSFPITGRVVADLPLNAAFNAATPAENGMILAINYATGEVVFPTGTDEMLGLHFSPEKEYDPSLPGLKNFKLTAEASNRWQGSSQGFRPRLGLLSVGERFTTNCLCYNTSTFGNNAIALAAFANYATTPLYGYADTSGAILVTTSAPSSEILALRVIDYTTVPNGDVGLKFTVVVAQ